MIAIFLAGWILVLPPFDEKGNARDNVPIGEWSQDSAYDTASKCEEGRLSHLSRLFDSEASSKAQTDETLKRAMHATGILSRCVPDYVKYPPPPGVTLNREQTDAPKPTP